MKILPSSKSTAKVVEQGGLGQCKSNPLYLMFSIEKNDKKKWHLYSLVLFLRCVALSSFITLRINFQEVILVSTLKQITRNSKSTALILVQR